MPPKKRRQANNKENTPNAQLDPLSIQNIIVRLILFDVHKTRTNDFSRMKISDNSKNIFKENVNNMKIIFKKN